MIGGVFADVLVRVMNYCDRAELWKATWKVGAAKGNLHQLGRNKIILQRECISVYFIMTNLCV